MVTCLVAAGLDRLLFEQDKAYPSSRLPGRLSTVYQFLESWARPAAAFQLVRLVRRLGRKRKGPRQRIRTTISQSGSASTPFHDLLTLSEARTCIQAAPSCALLGRLVRP